MRKRKEKQMEISEEELNKKIEEAVSKAKDGLLTQEQVDKIVSERVNKTKEQHKKELEEAQKVAKMTEAEKQKHDFEILTQERDELKKSLAQREHKDKILSLMSERKIENSFYDIFSGIDDIEKAGTMMDKFNETLSARVNAEVDGKLQSNVPSENKEKNNVNDAALRKAMGL